MKATLATVLAFFSVGAAYAAPTFTLTHLRGNVYVVQEDYPLSDENATVYVGKDFITVVGASWTPENARILAQRTFSSGK